MAGAAENRLKHRDPRERSAVLPSVRVDLTAAQTIPSATDGNIILWSATHWASQPDWWDAGNAGLIVIPRPMLYEIRWFLQASGGLSSAGLRVNNDANQDLSSGESFDTLFHWDRGLVAQLNPNDILSLYVGNHSGADRTLNVGSYMTVAAIPGTENRTGL